VSRDVDIPVGFTGADRERGLVEDDTARRRLRLRCGVTDDQRGGGGEGSASNLSDHGGGPRGGQAHHDRVRCATFVKSIEFLGRRASRASESPAAFAAVTPYRATGMP